VVCLLKEIVFKLGGVHIVICLKDEFLEGLVYIDAVGVDTASLSMHACKLSFIHGVGAWWYDGNSVGVQGFHPRGRGDGRVFNLGHDDATVPMGSATRHGRNGDCVSIQRASFYLNVLKGGIVVYLGEDRVRKSVDDFLNLKGVAWRHVGVVLRL
jgi:hypothetical protein